jgi:hypothetical protein
VILRKLVQSHQPATASDFIVKDGKMTKFRKDDVVVGGTNLGGGSTEVISLLERLVSAVENGGTVTLDGQKVGPSYGIRFLPTSIKSNIYNKIY